MSRRTRRLEWMAVAWIAIACCACERRGTAAAAQAQDAPRPHASDGSIGIDARMRTSIKVEPVAERRSVTVLAIAGKVQFDEDRVARVLVPLAGQLVDLRVKVGDTARKGEPLFSINSREAAAAVAEHIESHKDLELAEKTAAMTDDLFAHEAASRIAVQQAQSDLAKARSRVARTEEALRVLGLPDDLDFAAFNGRVPVVSPIAGVVIDRRVTQGQFVQSDSTPVVTVANLSEVWVVGDVFERDLHAVSIGQTALITTAAYPGERFEGRVNYISDAIDPATRTAKVRVSVPNRDGRLKPEMFASVSLNVEENDRVMMVPSEAVFTEEGKSYVYVEAGANRFTRRPIDIGSGEGPLRLVRSGLRAGERVVVDGAILLRQEEAKQAS